MHSVEFVIQSSEIGFRIPGRKGMISWAVNVGYNSSPRRYHSIVRACQSDALPNKVSTWVQNANLHTGDLDDRWMISPIQHFCCSGNLIEKLIVRTWKLNLHILLAQKVRCLSRRGGRKSIYVSPHLTMTNP